MLYATLYVNKNIYVFTILKQAILIKTNYDIKIYG